MTAGCASASTQSAAAKDEKSEEQTPAADVHCPMCAFIEAGDCKNSHQVWTVCREQAKRDGLDYVDECHENFKGFMQCAIENSDYYEPFLSMLLGEDTDEGKPGDGKADETHSAGSVAAPAPSNP